MKFRNTVPALVVAPCLLLLSAAQANMPGTFQPLLMRPIGGQLSCAGGTVTTSGGNTINTFNSSGTLTCTGSGTANFLVVGGGGGGGCIGGGGGGAGGFLTGSTTLSSGSFSITV